MADCAIGIFIPDKKQGGGAYAHQGVAVILREMLNECVVLTWLKVIVEITVDHAREKIAGILRGQQINGDIFVYRQMRTHCEFAKDLKLCVIVIVQYAKAIFQTKRFGGVVQTLKQKLVVRQWHVAFAMLGDIGLLVKPEVIRLRMHIGVKTLLGIFVDEKREVIRVFFSQMAVGFEKRLAAAPRIQRGEMVDFVADFRGRSQLRSATPSPEVSCPDGNKIHAIAA